MPRKQDPKSTAERQAMRNKRIVDAGLVQRKVVGHSDDFYKIREYAKALYKQRGIEFD